MGAAEISGWRAARELRLLLAFGHYAEFGPAVGFGLLLLSVFPELLKLLPRDSHLFHEGLDKDLRVSVLQSVFAACFAGCRELKAA